MNPSARREIRFSEKDAALRDDVHTLGALVGEVIREQGGETLFQRVETARIAAIRRREEGEVGGAGDAELEAAVGGLGPRDVAELVHRVRRRRDYLRAEGTGAAPQEGGLEDALRRLAAAGLGLAAVNDVLQRLVFEPVFTAHPTEATRRTLLEKQQVIGRLLVRRLDQSTTPAEERALLGRIREE